MENLTDPSIAFTKSDGLFYTCFEFTQINFNYYFDRAVNLTTNPVSVTYTANPEKDGASIGEAYFSFLFTRYYIETKIPIPTSTKERPFYKLKKNDMVMVIGNMAHLLTSEPIGGFRLSVPSDP